MNDNQRLNELNNRFNSIRLNNNHNRCVGFGNNSSIAYYFSMSGFAVDYIGGVSGIAQNDPSYKNLQQKLLNFMTGSRNRNVGLSRLTDNVKAVYISHNNNELSIPSTSLICVYNNYFANNSAILNNISREFKKQNAKYFSCLERKILSSFPMNWKSGNIYVSRKPCKKCLPLLKGISVIHL